MIIADMGFYSSIIVEGEESMNTEIKLNPDELRGQAERLAALSNRMQDISDKTQDAVQLMAESVSRDFALHLDWKGKMLVSKLDSLTEGLQLGEKFANDAANKLEDTDKNIGKKPAEIIEDIINSSRTVKNTLERIRDGKKEEFRRQKKMEEIEMRFQRRYSILEYEGHIMSQNDYDGPEFEYGWNNCGCTATSWCMGLSMITGKKYVPNSSEMWDTDPAGGWSGAKFPGQGESVWGDPYAMMQEAYNQLQNGKPSVFYAQTSNCPHAVTIVGIAENADPNNLKLEDFLVVDPWGWDNPGESQVKRLSDVGYVGYPGYSRLITYSNNLP